MSGSYTTIYVTFAKPGWVGGKGC